MLVATIFFIIALLGIILLYGVKFIEVKRERVFAGPLRSRADDAARTLKVLLMRTGGELRKVPPALTYLTRFVLHEAALAAAALMRYAEEQMHRVADLVSHKRSFQPREQRNEFLKQVGEVKSENLDTTEGTGQNS